MINETFIEMCQNGTKKFEDLSDFISLWYKTPDEEKINLQDSIGLTDEEYSKFLSGNIDVVKALIDYNFEFDWVKTCDAFPEQYDVFLKGSDRKVAYVRERWDSISVDCPDTWEERVYDGMGHIYPRTKIEIEEAVKKWIKDSKIKIRKLPKVKRR